jgi:two-component system response regulator
MCPSIDQTGPGGRELPTVLLVDDDENDVELTLRAFRKNDVPSDVVVLRDGVEALDYLFGTGPYEGRDTTDLPRVIFLDLKMPRLDGLEVLRRSRADARTRLVPVVILTSSTEESDLLRGYGLGANSYVRKPVDFSEFLEAARQLGLYWLRLNRT